MDRNSWDCSGEGSRSVRLLIVLITGQLGIVPQLNNCGLFGLYLMHWTYWPTCKLCLDYTCPYMSSLRHDKLRLWDKKPMTKISYPPPFTSLHAWLELLALRFLCSWKWAMKRWKNWFRTFRFGRLCDQEGGLDIDFHGYYCPGLTCVINEVDRLSYGFNSMSRRAYTITRELLDGFRSIWN